MKILNEALYFIGYHLFLEARDEAQLRTLVFEPYRGEHGPFQWNGDTIFFAEDVNSPEMVGFLKNRRPDICSARCISSYFKEEIRNLPKFATFL
jgi:hypothetical protein